MIEQTTGVAGPARVNRRPRKLTLLKPILPNAGRAKAGADTAAKRKSKALALILVAVSRLERADNSRRPTIIEVAGAAGVSTDTVRRRCAEDAVLAARIKFSNEKRNFHESSDGAGKLERVILSLSSQNELLATTNRDLREQIDRLKSQMKHEREGRSMPDVDISPRSETSKRSLRVVQNHE